MNDQERDQYKEVMEAIARTGVTAAEFAAAVSANAKAAPSWLDLTDDTPTSQRE